MAGIRVGERERWGLKERERWGWKERDLEGGIKVL